MKTKKKLKKKIRSFSSFPRKTLKSFLPLSSLPRHSTHNKTTTTKFSRSLPTPNSFSLSLSSFAHLRGKENGFKKRETRREHAPPLNNISAPVVHHE
tara:strand:+ start:340 stop:630 length:291 start_codon:yes stop_codon:yes gene_type:complete